MGQELQSPRHKIQPFRFTSSPGRGKRYTITGSSVHRLLKMRLYFGKYPGQAPHHGDGLRNFWRSRSWTYIKGRLQKLRGSLGDHRRSYGYFDLEDACFSPMDGKNFLLYKCLSSFDASSWISWDGIYRLFGSSIYSCHYNIQVVSFINYHTNGSLYCQ